MKSISLLIAALFALTSTSTSAFAEGDGDGQHGGQGGGKTDRSNSHAPVICNANETAMAVQGADGNIVWTCTSAAGSAS